MTIDVQINEDKSIETCTETIAQEKSNKIGFPKMSLFLTPVWFITVKA